MSKLDQNMERLSAYTRGSIEGTMLKTALTMLPATLAMSGYNIADSYFVGQLGDDGAMAAMANTGPVIMFACCIFMGLGTGIMANLAHALGRGDSRESTRLVSSGILLACICSTIVCIVGLLFSNAIFGWMGAEGRTLVLTRQYMDIWLYGCVTSILSMEGNTVLVAAGIPRLASIMSIVGLVINVIMDPILIFGWGFFPAMGIHGAALATVISQAVSAIVNVVILYRQGLLAFERIPFRELLTLWRIIIRYAVPAALGAMLMPIGMYITQRITYELSYILGHGDKLVAGLGQAGRLELVAFVVPMSLGRALMPMIGQNYGAKLYSRVKRCFFFSTAFAQSFLMVLAFVIYFLFPYAAPYLAPGQPDVQRFMILFMQITPFGFGCLEGMRFACFTIMGCGHPKTDGCVKMFRVLVFQIPLAFLALKMESVSWLMAGRLLTDILSFAVAFSLALFYVLRLPEDGEKKQTEKSFK